MIKLNIVGAEQRIDLLSASSAQDGPVTEEREEEEDKGRGEKKSRSRDEMR